MLASASSQCTKERPCRRSDPCTRCEAARVLTSGDWYAIDFYLSVADQTTDSGLPSFPAYKVALDAHSYPPSLHGWLLKTAGLLHRLISKVETVEWFRECGKSYRDITREDVTDD